MSNAFAELSGKAFGANATFFRDNYVAVNIYYKDIRYSKIEEQEAYSTLALMADIGGALGLILGSTLMTLVEILDFILSYFHLKRSQSERYKV